MAAAESNSADADDETVESGTATSLPTAVVVPPRGDPKVHDPTRWLRRGIFLGALAVGWLFILWVNRFTFSAPTVFVCLAYLALVSTGYALWRTGVVVVTEDDDEGDSTWGRPIGRRAELEREKKTLLKAIKEAEFDREMGKLSKADADEMIAVYRVRAIEVIKELEQMSAGGAGTVREQIEREVKARLELEAKADKAKADAIADAKKDKKKREARSAPKAASKAAAKPESKNESKPESNTSEEHVVDISAKKTERPSEDELVNKAVEAVLNTPGTKVSVSVDSETGEIDVKSNASEDAKTKNDESKEATS